MHLLTIDMTLGCKGLCICTNCSRDLVKFLFLLLLCGVRFMIPTHLIVPLVSKLMHSLLIVTGYKGGGCCTNSESISSESTLWQQGANYSRSAGASNTNLCSLG
jgi:hypothetical protein